MKQFIIILILAGAWITGFAQTANISGTVVSDNQPLPGATISLNGRAKTITDSSGAFHFQTAKTAKAHLLISAAEHLAFDTILRHTGDLFISVTLQRDRTLNDEVVISGTMKAVSKTASPIPVEVYTPAFFKKKPTPSIFEGLQMVNGIQPQLNCNVCNTGDIHINGMEGPYTMILIDGMPILSSLSTVYGLNGIPNSIVKRMEIVKGPASTLYGSEAVAGLINIITKDARNAGRITVDVSGTSAGEITADVSSGYRFKKIDGLMGINYFNYSQPRDINADNFTDVALQKRISIFNKWNTALSAFVNTSLALRYIYENRWGGEMQWQEKFRGSDSIYGESVLTKRFELISSTSFRKNFTADISFNYHRQQSYYGTIKYFATQQVGFAQLRWNKRFASHDLLAGIPLRYTVYDDNTPGTSTPEGINRPDKIFLPGLFVQYEWNMGKKVVLLSGMRYDYNNHHGSILTPRLSIKYAPSVNNTFRLSGGNGYRVVNLFTEDHAALTGARKVEIAGNLKPEKSWNANINYTGIIRHSSGFINLDASAFFTYFTNKIVADYFSDPLKIIYDNLNGYAISKGITINTDFYFTNGIKLIAGATFMDVYQATLATDGKKIKTPQLFAPKISGTFTASYKIPGILVLTDITGKINGPMYLPVVPNDYRDEQSPAYCTLNLQFTKAIRNFEVYCGAKNLLNFIPQNALLHADDPFNKPGGKYFDATGNPRADTNPYGYTFDPSYNYATIQGIKIYAGLRWQIQ